MEKIRDFTRVFLKEIGCLGSEKAKLFGEASDWKRAYQDLAHAAFTLDASIARTEYDQARDFKEQGGTSEGPIKVCCRLCKHWEVWHSGDGMCVARPQEAHIVGTSDGTIKRFPVTKQFDSCVLFTKTE